MALSLLQRFISRAHLRQRLGHALLLLGDSTEDKVALSRYFAKALLCDKRTIEQETLKPCEQCINCTQTEAKRHPNVEWVGNEDFTEIKIEQIREVKERLRLSSFDNKARLIIITDAQAITLQAANALLKSIEEPQTNQYFLLLAEASSAVLKTLVSRCQKMKMPPTGTTTDVALSQYAESTLARILQNGLQGRMALVDEIEKKECEKTLLLLEFQKKLHACLRLHPSIALLERKRRLKAIEATRQARLLLEQNANTRLTLEQWLLNAWPIENASN